MVLQIKSPPQSFLWLRLLKFFVVYVSISVFTFVTLWFCTSRSKDSFIIWPIYSHIVLGRNFSKCIKLIHFKLSYKYFSMFINHFQCFFLCIIFIFSIPLKVYRSCFELDSAKKFTIFCSHLCDMRLSQRRVTYFFQLDNFPTLAQILRLSILIVAFLSN